MVENVSLNRTAFPPFSDPPPSDLNVTRALLLADGFFFMVPPSGESQLNPPPPPSPLVRLLLRLPVEEERDEDMWTPPL